ncbi:hypothetical protein [Arthrobacter sp. K5]|uniref:Uncharacterized protein n=1 Tax=Arthrobacter sp. K5 TaxID=2839623 RepID=A0AAU8EWE2_9MICC
MKTAQRLTEVTVSQNWSGLSAGQHVTVTEPVGEPYQAVIDVKTDDSGVVWVETERMHVRRAFDYREGVIITPA